LLGSGVVKIIGLNPDEVQVCDFIVELSNNGFYTQAQVDKDVQWSRRVGVNSRSPKAVSFYLLPCAKYQI
jgi:hypothetical protein